MKGVITSLLVVIFTLCRGWEVCHYCKVKVGKYAERFCTMVEQLPGETAICADLLENHGPIQSSYEPVCEDIELCPNSPDEAVANAKRCSQCKTVMGQYVIKFCDEYKNFVDSHPNMEYSGGCHSLAHSLDSDTFGNICRNLDQCKQFPEILLPVENYVNGINMTKFLENQENS